MEKSRYRYYSQNGEDYLLWQLFDYKSNGFYVDIGAFDGVHLSNSFSFEQQRWKGICVEPHPRYFALCQQTRPLAHCVQAACVGDENIKSVEFYSEALGLLSGVIEDQESVQNKYQRRGLDFEGFTKLTVPAITLNALLDQYALPSTEIDFISIDVEGFELEVLQGLDLSRYRPRVLLLEANSAEAERRLDEYLVQQNGYFKARQLSVNIFYVRDAPDVARLKSTPVNCTLQRNLHPLGVKYTIPAFTQENKLRESLSRTARLHSIKRFFHKLKR